MIPKKIHYCWFGRNEKSLDVLSCIMTWKKNLPDYEIKEWNESNYDVFKNSYTTDCYLKRKWAHLSDYVRADLLYRFGGIYFDVDVVVNKNLDEFLTVQAFSGFEIPGIPFTATWGTEEGHPWPKLVLDYYEKIGIFEDKTINSIVTNILVENFKIDKDNHQLQQGSNGVVIFPSNYFTNEVPTNFTTHKFHGSWLSENIDYYTYCNSVFYSNYINKETILNFLDTRPNEVDLLDVLNSFKIQLVLKSVIRYFFFVFKKKLYSFSKNKNL